MTTFRVVTFRGCLIPIPGCPAVSTRHIVELEANNQSEAKEKAIALGEVEFPADRHPVIAIFADPIN